MLGDYFAAASSEDGAEFGRCASLIDSMQQELNARPGSPTVGSVLSQLDESFVGAPVAPSRMLRRALDNAILNLAHLTTLVRQPGLTVSVPVFMTAMRISLLGCSHLSYIATAPDAGTLRERTEALYRLETRSARKFVETVTAVSHLHGLHPPVVSEIRSIAAYADQLEGRGVTESKLLDEMKNGALNELLGTISVPSEVASLLVDQLFNTTSGAAHAYYWIDAVGVTLHFVQQLSWTTTLTNIAFNQFIDMAGMREQGGPAK